VAQPGCAKLDTFPFKVGTRPRREMLNEFENVPRFAAPGIHIFNHITTDESDVKEPQPEEFKSCTDVKNDEFVTLQTVPTEVTELVFENSCKLLYMFDAMLEKTPALAYWYAYTETWI